MTYFLSDEKKLRNENWVKNQFFLNNTVGIKRWMFWNQKYVWMEQSDSDATSCQPILHGTKSVGFGEIVNIIPNPAVTKNLVSYLM